MTDVSIRSCTPSDVSDITRIYAHAVRFGTASFEIEPPDEAEMTLRWEGLVSQGFPYLVAVQNEAVLGYAYAGFYRTRPAYRWSVEDSLYIHPEYQGQGIGGLLLRALIDQCEALGFRQMIAVIGDSASRGSIRVHEKAGFVRSGVLSSIGFKQGRWLDCVLMQRALGQGSTSAPAS